MVARSRSPTGRQQSPLPSSWGGLRAGALVWFVPFPVACCFVNPEDGTKTIGPDWFRVLMLTLGSLAGTYATHRCNPQTRRAGLTLALQILVVNYLLDLLVLVPLMIKEATDEEQFSIAPGQAAVFYDGERVLGGGLIQRESDQPTNCT